jgi:hypothetical protein
MAIGAILAVIGAIAVQIWDGVKFVSERAFEILRELLKVMYEGFKWFLASAPRPVLMLFFFFFILTIGNLVTGFVVQTNFACDSNDQLREYESMIGGIQGYFEAAAEDFDNSSTDYETFINESTVPSNRFGSGENYTDVLNVGCAGQKPILRFFTIPFLDPKIWILILVLGVLIQIGLAARRK